VNHKAAARIAAVLAWLTSAPACILLFSIAGCALAIAGTHMLFGTGAALIVGAAFCFILAALLAIGVRNNG